MESADDEGVKLENAVVVVVAGTDVVEDNVLESECVGEVKGEVERTIEVEDESEVDLAEDEGEVDEEACSLGAANDETVLEATILRQLKGWREKERKQRLTSCPRKDRNVHPLKGARHQDAMVAPVPPVKYQTR